jgi:hypothetical protein
MNRESNFTYYGRLLSAVSINTHIFRLLDDYYKTSLRKCVDMSTIDVNAIAKENDVDEILSLVELVVGAAVMCESKATFIQKIFSLNHASQTALKGHIEQVMQRMTDYDGEGDDSFAADAGGSGRNSGAALSVGLTATNRSLEASAAVSGMYGGDVSEELIRYSKSRVV